MSQAPPRFVVGRAGPRYVIIARLQGRALVVGSACDELHARRLVDVLRKPRLPRLENQCLRKVVYEDRARAQAAIARRHHLHPYHCPFCGQWHVGHKAKPPRP